ncbi:ribonuclease H-like domain-containing protein [Tanacetum coccineum]
MMIYLKHVGGKKHANLKNKNFKEIQVLYKKVKRSDKDFIAIGSAEDDRQIKEMNEESKDPKRRGLSMKLQGKKIQQRKRPRPQPDDDSDDEYRKCLRIVTFDSTLVSKIMETKSFVSKLHKVSSPDGDYLVVYRVNGHFRAFNYLMEVLHIFDRQDLFHLYDLVMKQYSEITPEGIELILWGDLKIMMESLIEENNQELKDGTVIYMLVERRYPLSKELLQKMLDLGLEVEEESTAALHLVLANHHITNALQFTMSNRHQELTSPEANGFWSSIHLVVYNEELAIPDQTATGKGISNPLMAGSLPKTTKPTYGSYMPKRFDYVDPQGRLKSVMAWIIKILMVDLLHLEEVLKEVKLQEKKNSVLLTETECLVLSLDFKLLDESQVLLKIPRQNNMYSFDLKNVVPSGDLTYLFAKTIIDESNLWHKRLGHINFKTMNKLVRGNLVRGLPLKLFENDHTCVACQKGKQHKASLYNRKSYCLVVTDDFSKFSWVFFLANKDETPKILKNFITGIENQSDHKVKTIRSDNRTEFKNRIMNEFYKMKDIRREFSIARTPQQNGVAERKNRTLIEASRTMLADSKLPTTFWAEAVNTACYVQNRVLVIKPHNKTPYKFFLGRKHALSFIRPFGCLVTILNTLDHLGKFDDRFFVGYSINSKAFRVFNTRTRFVEENLQINFLENKPNVVGTGPNWMFGIDTLTMSMNYQPVFVGNQTNGNAEDEVADDAGKKNGVEDPTKEDDINGSGEATNTNSTNRLNTVSLPVNVVSSSFTTVDPGRARDQRNEFESVFGQDKDANSTYMMLTPVSAAESYYENLGGSTPVNAATPYNVDYPTDPLMPDLEDTADLQDTGIFDNTYDDDEDVGAEADLNNLETTMNVSPIPTTRIHKDHPKEQIIGDINSATQTMRMIKMSEEHAMIKAMQEELLQFRLQKVWRLVDLPKGKHAIGKKWVYRNKKDERGIVVRNKARLIAQGYTQEKGINYDEVFAPVARIECHSIYYTIEEEVYACQHPGFEDPQFPNNVYMVDKALYGLHQDPRAWYETLSTYLLENGFRRRIIDKTLFIKKEKSDILLVQVYVDDIIFGSTKKSLCIKFESLMHKRFQMSSMGELTFFFGLQVKQKDDGIFISQDKYMVDTLKKFNFSSVKIASTLLETNKALIKDEEAEDVDVHLISMIGSLMYLTGSRPNIMFAIYACARFQVTPKTSHLHAMKRIFRYLKGQPKLGLWYPRDSPFDLEAFSDSDYARASLDKKSTTGGVMDPKSNA